MLWLCILLHVPLHVLASPTIHAAVSESDQARYLYDARNRHHARNNNDGGHRSHYDHYQTYPARSSAQQQQHSQSTKQKYPKRYYTNLSDVWLCLAMALGWTVWMLSSLVRSDLLRYREDSVLVRGHVLQVSVEEDSLGTGIPTYKAVIDYTLNGGSQETIQVRKHFETQRLLEQGFANVEILVLPEEPTYSVLREDYYQQVEEHKEDEEEALIRQTWCKRLSMAFAGILVLVSLGGCVQVVVRLDPLTRWQGWASLCLGVTLMLPAGLLVHRALQAFQRIMEFQSEKAGVILRGATSSMKTFWDEMDVLDPRACDDDPVEHIHPAPQKEDYTATAGCYFVEFGPKKARSIKTPTPSHRDDLQGAVSAMDSSLSTPQPSVDPMASSTSSLSSVTIARSGSEQRVE